MIHTVKGFFVVSEVEVDVFLEFLCSLHDLLNVSDLLSHPAAQVACLLTWPSTGLNWCVQIAKVCTLGARALQVPLGSKPLDREVS